MNFWVSKFSGLPSKIELGFQIFKFSNFWVILLKSSWVFKFLGLLMFLLKFVQSRTFGTFFEECTIYGGLWYTLSDLSPALANKSFLRVGKYSADTW